VIAGVTIALRLFTDLLLTLNTAYPDYDFMRVRPEDFIQETNYNRLQHSIHSSLQQAMAQQPTLATTLWNAIETIQPQECDIFSYFPSAESPLSQDSM
jgi:hypothetical protein